MKLPVQFRPTPLVTKLLILLVMLSCVVLLVGQQSRRRANELEAQALEEQIAELKEANQKLAEDLAALGSDDSVENIAREELGLVGSGEIIFSDMGD